MNRRLVTYVALIFYGAILGVTVSRLVKSGIVVKAEKAELKKYAHRLVDGAEKFATEVDRAQVEVAHDHLSFCSDRELLLMRKLIFGSAYIKDIGRTKDKMLYCTADNGRLAEPFPMERPDISINGRNIYTSVPLRTSGNLIGFKAEYQGISVVLNPEAFNILNEPPKFYSAFFYDPQSLSMVRDFGNAVPLSREEILAGKLIERNDMFFQPLCSLRPPVCEVAIERRQDMLVGGKGIVVTSMVGSGILGAMFGLVLILIFQRQSSLEQQLRRAIRHDGLTLVYQPIVDLKTGVMVGAEALVRWINDAGESVNPDLFVSLAEEKGFANEITQFVLRRVLDELCDLLAKGDLRITINITAQDLTDPIFFELLKQSLAIANIKTSSLGLELTERSTADKELAINSIARLQRAGHTVYIDDFGTGYSSLAYLNELAVDAIKIDRAFTQTVDKGTVTACMIPQLLDIARQLRLLVVVEGVETAEQVRYFRRAGNGILGQGYLFSKPVDAARLQQLTHKSFLIPNASSDAADLSVDTSSY